MSRGDNFDEITGRVGYESGAAFSKAFKREKGIAPWLYRRKQLAATDWRIWTFNQNTFWSSLNGETWAGMMFVVGVFFARALEIHLVLSILRSGRD